MLLDLNFNAKTEGYLKILRAIADIEMFWVEADSYSPAALAYIRRQSPHPISSCETLLGLREFLPYFREQAMDVAIVDAVWNGVWQSMKIAAAADAHEVNIAPHNFYGHLATMMNAHFAAATPNLRIMEVDIDRLPWDEELFTKVPRFEGGTSSCPTSRDGAQSRTKRKFAHMSRGPGAGCSVIVKHKRDSGARWAPHHSHRSDGTRPPEAWPRSGLRPPFRPFPAGPSVGAARRVRATGASGRCRPEH